jgi:hypothetical protein
MNVREATALRARVLEHQRLASVKTTAALHALDQLIAPHDVAPEHDPDGMAQTNAVTYEGDPKALQAEQAMDAAKWAASALHQSLQVTSTVLYNARKGRE